MGIGLQLNALYESLNALGRNSFCRLLLAANLFFVPGISTSNPAFSQSSSASNASLSTARAKSANVLPNSSIDANGKIKVDSAPELLVKEIQIQGNQLIPAADILRVLKTEKGDIFFCKQLVEGQTSDDFRHC